MTPPNEEMYRGSNFIFGPVTGSESPADLSVEFIAGGFRTPNGLEVGPENEIYVADNQGVFNPSNELIRLEKGGFYGHYLYNKGGRQAAHQPGNIDANKGGAHGQRPATVHLPQGIVARSPAQPHVLQGLTGEMADYNGQILLCEFTGGSLLRVALEEVDGQWQGVAFKHTGGVADQDGNGGFTGGPNRLVQGPDGHYYIGQIGAGGLWEFNGSPGGLQRLKVKGQKPADFNEILTVKVADGGFEIEFLKPIKALAADELDISQWTYIPTNGYGGAPVGTEKLKCQSVKLLEGGKKAYLQIDGLKDGSPQYVHKKDYYSSANTGYVVQVKLKSSAAVYKDLYTKEFWYTLHKKKGGRDLASDQIVKATAAEQAKAKYDSLCISCHVARGSIWAAPDLKGILGREQVVLKAGVEQKVTVDREYIINAIMNPESEKVLKYKDVYMAQLGIKRKEAEALADYIIQLK